MTQNYLDHTFGHGNPCHTPSNMTHLCDGTLHCLHRPHISGSSLPRTSDRHTLQLNFQYECSSLFHINNSDKKSIDSKSFYEVAVQQFGY